MKRLIALLLALSLDASAYERTSWATSPNNLLDNTSTTTISKNAAWYLMEGIGCASAAWNSSPPAAGCWTYYCGSDSSTADACDGSPGTDPWTTTYTAAKIVSGAANAVHSWITFKAPAAAPHAMYLTFDYLAAATSSVIVSKNPPAAVALSGTSAGTTTVTMPSTAGILVGMTVTAPTGNCSSCTVNTVNVNVSVVLSAAWSTSTAQTYTFIGGTKSRYTATDEWSHTSWAFNSASIATVNRAHLSLSSSGDFWFCNTRDSQNTFCSGAAAQPLAFAYLQDTKSGDLVTAVSSIVGAQTGTISAGGSTTTWSDALTGFKGRDVTDTTNYTFGGAIPMLISGSANNMFAGTGTTTFQGAGDSADSKQVDFPIYLFSTATGAVTMKGRLPDFRWAPAINSQGTTSPASPPYDSVIHSTAAWIPWNTSVQPIL